MRWEVKTARVEDQDKWFDFVRIVQSDFCNISLIDDKLFCEGAIKNMERGTALMIEDTSLENNPVIGAVSYSPRSNHISWLAVNREYRRRGVATALLERVFCELSSAEKIEVKTFLYDDEYGKAARNFYKSQGFIPCDVIMDAEGFPHPVQVFVKPLT